MPAAAAPAACPRPCPAPLAWQPNSSSLECIPRRRSCTSRRRWRATWRAAGTLEAPRRPLARRPRGDAACRRRAHPAQPEACRCQAGPCSRHRLGTPPARQSGLPARHGAGRHAALPARLCWSWQAQQVYHHAFPRRLHGAMPLSLTLQPCCAPKHRHVFLFDNPQFWPSSSLSAHPPSHPSRCDACREYTQRWALSFQCMRKPPSRRGADQPVPGLLSTLHAAASHRFKHSLSPRFSAGHCI